jgi:hypothetical protein
LDLLIILLYPIVVIAQPANGDGSSGNPYSGAITTPDRIVLIHMLPETPLNATPLAFNTILLAGWPV